MCPTLCDVSLHKAHTTHSESVYNIILRWLLHMRPDRGAKADVSYTICYTICKSSPHSRCCHLADVGYTICSSSHHSRCCHLADVGFIICQGGYGCLCRVQNIACYRMRMGFIGVQVAHSVADDLNIYYEQFPCVGRPNFSLENRPMKVGAFYEATAELKGFH